VFTEEIFLIESEVKDFVAELDGLKKKKNFPEQIVSPAQPQLDDGHLLISDLRCRRRAFFFFSFFVCRPFTATCSTLSLLSPAQLQLHPVPYLVAL